MIHRRSYRHHPVFDSRVDLVPTPCLDDPWPYDVLIEFRGGQVWRSALAEARRLCGGCPVMATCFRDNQNERWVRSIITGRSTSKAAA